MLLPLHTLPHCKLYHHYSRTYSGHIHYVTLPLRRHNYPHTRYSFRTSHIDKLIASNLLFTNTCPSRLLQTAYVNPSPLYHVNHFPLSATHWSHINITNGQPILLGSCSQFLTSDQLCIGRRASVSRPTHLRNAWQSCLLNSFVHSWCFSTFYDHMPLLPPTPFIVEGSSLRCLLRNAEAAAGIFIDTLPAGCQLYNYIII